MVSIRDVAAYILQKLGPLSAMKLQKLCYFAYGYHLAWEERPLFPEHFEAWANGPVSPALYGLHRGRFEVTPEMVAGDPAALDAGEAESVDLVLEGLGGYTAHQLSTMTHTDGPWVSARQRAGAQGLDRSNQRLADDEIAEFFDALTSNPQHGQA